MQLDAYVQGVFYKTITVPNTNSALILITQDIENGLVANFDVTKPSQIRLSAPKTNDAAPAPVSSPVVPQTTTETNPFEKWAGVAPQNPQRFDIWLAPDESEWIYDQPRSETGRYLADDSDTPEKESALRWVPHIQINPDG